MQKRFVGLFLSVAASGLAACGGMATQVEVKGGNEDVISLAGNWEGQYEGTESGRSGGIKFSLELGRHTADGEVMLGAGAPPLKISFVRVEGGQVSGKMEPYMDPNCSCTVQTEFLGLVHGDVADGTFTTRAVQTGSEQHGNWTVQRRKDG